MSRRKLYPELKPNQSGYLKVSGGHRLYWEECGNPEGKPAVFVHGGPGAGAGPVSRRFFTHDATGSSCSTSEAAVAASPTPA